LILGTGRSGSTFLTHVFRQWGLDLGHEQVGELGTSSHFFHEDHHWYPYFPWEDGKAHVGERLNDYIFRNKLHVIRDPLKCIPSIEKVLTSINWEFAEETGVIPALKMSKRERVMMYWLHLNRKMEAICDRTIRLEDIDVDLIEYLDDVGINHGVWPDLPPKNKGTGFKKSDPITFDDLYEVDPTLAQELLNYAYTKGYKL